MFSRTFSFRKCCRLLMCYVWILILINVSARSVILKRSRPVSRGERAIEALNSTITSNVSDTSESTSTAITPKAVLKQADKTVPSEMRNHVMNTVNGNWKSIPRNDNVYQKDDIVLAQDEFVISGDNRSNSTLDFHSGNSTADYSREYVLGDYNASAPQGNVTMDMTSDNNGSKHISAHSEIFVMNLSTQTPGELVHLQFDSNQSLHSRDHSEPNNTSLHSHHDVMGDHGIHVASWNYAYVETPLLIALFMIIAGICKLGFHHVEVLSSIVPESCVLITLGICVGAILHLSGQDEAFPVYMTPRLFFLFLLPPIILESAFSLHDRVFFDNIGTVLILAVIGTVLNCFLIGPSLYMLSQNGGMGDFHISLVHCLVFSSLIVAVDPVAVLAIFQEVGVNNVLYFLVFGESLLNDAVTVVLYNMMKSFSSMSTIAVSQIFMGIASFFTVSFGGLSIGVLCGVLTALVTKYTSHVRVIEPLAVFVLAYLSYLCAELFHFSGIISIIACGLTQANYTFHNISQKSLTTITYFSKMQSATCDCIIFLFLGMSIFRTTLTWNTGFILWTLVLCLVFRFVVVFLLAYILNKVNRLRTINLEEQFIMAYGGLRGAVCFSLVDTLDPDTMPHRDLFVTSTLAVIFFTVFIQGTSIKPFVKLLRITLLETKDLSMYDEINNHVTDHVMAGIEEVMGQKGDNFWRVWLEHYDDVYLRHWLQRHPSTTDERIMEMYEKIALRQHFENLTGTRYQDVYGDSYAPLDDIPGGDEGHIHAEGDAMNMQERLLEQYERKKSLVPAITTTPKRRKSQFSSSFRYGRDMDGEGDDAVASPPEPTVQDVKRIMAQKPTNLLHQNKADRNLKGHNWSNVMQLLAEKQQRTRRMSRCMSFAPIVPGTPSSRGRTPSISRDRLAHIAEEDDDGRENKLYKVPDPKSPNHFQETNSSASPSMSQKRRSYGTFSPQDIDRIRKISRLKSSLRRSTALTNLSFEDEDMDVMKLSPLVNIKSADGYISPVQYHHAVSPELSPQVSPNIHDIRRATSLHDPEYGDAGETYANRRQRFLSTRAVESGQLSRLGHIFSIAEEAIPEVDWSEEEDDDCDEGDGKEVDDKNNSSENLGATSNSHEENEDNERTVTQQQQQQQQQQCNVEDDILSDVSIPTILDEPVTEGTIS